MLPHRLIHTGIEAIKLPFIVYHIEDEVLHIITITVFPNDAMCSTGHVLCFRILPVLCPDTRIS